VSQTAPLFVVSGASGSGKTTLCRRLANEYGWYYSISFTTRAKRSHEIHGRDYFFVSRDEFERMVAKGDFLEWAEVYQNLYGTSRRLIEESLAKGQGVILDVDTQGAGNLKAILPQAVTVFIDTPSVADLEVRLKARATDAADEIARRVAHAQKETAKKGQYDCVIVNDDLERAVAEFKELIKQHG
jgi:guanylate kinase